MRVYMGRYSKEGKAEPRHEAFKTEKGARQRPRFAKMRLEWFAEAFAVDKLNTKLMPGFSNVPH